jgi:small subunit ribosomal protein YMR-31
MMSPQSAFYQKVLSRMQLIALSESIDHSPHPHPASPSSSLPTTFSTYRQQAQQHGPLGRTRSSSTSSIGGRSGSDLGSVKPADGMYFDRNELPLRFRRTPFTEAEIEAIETGGATMVC